MSTPSTKLNLELLELVKGLDLPDGIYENVEYQKMISGMIYEALDPQLVRARVVAHNLADEYNDMRLRDFDNIDQLTVAKENAIKQLFGRSGKPGLVESPMRVDYGYNTIVGDNFYANFGLCLLDCSIIKIGNNCMFAPNVTVCTATHPLNAKERISGVEFALPITIGDNVWVGANATILPGVTIGDNAVIAAGAVVSRDVNANTVVAGIPAKKIRDIDNTNLELEDPDLD